MKLPGINSGVVIESPNVSITKNNTYIGSEVIQNKNISAVGRFKYTSKLKWFLIIFGALYLPGVFMGAKTLILPAILFIGLGLLIKTKHGVAIFTNSGRYRLIESTNDIFITDVVTAYYDLFEKGLGEGRIIIHVKEQNINIENNIIGDNNTQAKGDNINIDAGGGHE